MEFHAMYVENENVSIGTPIWVLLNENSLPGKHYSVYSMNCQSVSVL